MSATQAEVMFRFYRPDRALMDKTWTLPDIEKLWLAREPVALPKPPRQRNSNESV